MVNSSHTGHANYKGCGCESIPGFEGAQHWGCNDMS